MPKRKPVSSQPDNSTVSARPPLKPRSRASDKRDEKRVNKRCLVDSETTFPESPKGSPAVELAQVAGIIPAENLQHVATAVQSGRWLLAVWHVADGRLHLERTATNFPTVDLERSVAMLADNLKELSEPS